MAAMLCLNSAAYSAWAARGPPTPVPEWWLHRAFTHLCYAGTALALGVALSLAVRARRVTRAAVAEAVIALLLLVLPHVRAFLLVDRCLDLGGRWNAPRGEGMRANSQPGKR